MSDMNYPPRVQEWHFRLPWFRPLMLDDGPLWFGYWAHVDGWELTQLDGKECEITEYKEYRFSGAEIEKRRADGLVQ